MGVTFRKRYPPQRVLKVQRNLPIFEAGGNDGDMEARIARLEAAVEKLSDGLTDVRVQLATLSERINNMPTKGFVFAAMSGVGAAIVMALTILSQLGYLNG